MLYRNLLLCIYKWETEEVVSGTEMVVVTVVALVVVGVTMSA